MKKIFIFLILSMFLISFTSAELFQFDNIKSYDAINKEVTITNTFGLGGEIAKIKLNTPLINYVHYGKDKEIARFQLTNYEDYNNIVDEVKTYYTSDLKTEIGRTFTYKIITYEEVINISKNGTEIREIKELQTPIEKMDFLKGDTYTIGIFTDVLIGDNVEWIPTFYGKEINEWATWISDNAIINGLGDYGSNTNPNIFQIGNDWYMLTGTGEGKYFGFAWNGTAWNYNSTIVSGLTNITTEIVTSVFYMGTDLYLIVGEQYGNWYGYAMASNHTTWLVNSTIIFGLPITQYNEAPHGFKKDESYYLLWTIHTGSLDGRVWNGTGWASNSTIKTGLLDTGFSRWNVFKKNGDYYAIGGATSGLFYGYKWSATNTWIVDLNINDTFGDVGSRSTPFVFNMTGTSYYMISGNGDGTFNGFRFLYFPTPQLILNSPINNTNTTNTLVTFNITATDEQQITNVTLYIDSVLNETNTSGVNGTYIFTKILSDGYHNWSVLAYNNNSQSNQSGTRFLTIDISIPIINITSPINGTINYTNFTKTNSIITSINWTASAFNLDKCFITNLSSGANETGTCNNLNRTYYLPFGSYTYLVYANDTFNHFGTGYSTIDYRYRLFENSINWTTPIVENTNQTYTFNFNKSSYLTISSLSFIYNNVSYSSPYSSSADYQTITNYFTTPLVTADTNYSFYWSVLFSDGTRVNSSFNTQQINNIVFGNCNATYLYPILNLSLVDEKTQLPIVGTIETNIQVKTSDGLTTLYNWSSSSSTGNNTLCSNVLLTSSYYKVYGTIKYFASNENYSASTEYYNYLNYTLNNITQNLNTTLYDLNMTEATDFQLTFKDSTFRAREDILIYVYRQYLPSGDFKLVELPKTDSNGQVVVHLVRNDVIYNFIAVDSSGNVLGTLNNVIAFCSDFTIGDCKINFQGISEETDLENYISDLGLSYTLSFNSVTNIVSFVFTSTTNTLKNMRLEVISSAVVTNRTLCNTSLTAIAGTLTCDVSSVVNSSSAINVKIFMDNKEIINDNLSLDNSNWNVPGVLFFGFLLLLIIGIMFIESKEGLIIGVILGFIVLVSLGIAKGKVIGFTSGILWLIIVGIIILIKLNKEKSP